MTTSASTPTTEQYVQAIAIMQDFFERSTRALEEADSEFAPAPGTYTLAQQVAHVAQTIEWFMHGAFDEHGFSLDFASLDAEVRQVTSLSEARAWWQRAIEAAKRTVASKTLEEMQQPLPDGPIMGGVPRSGIIDAMADHTAHHRGALTVYARLKGRVPPMPYGDM